MTDMQYLELAQRTLSTDKDKLGHFIVGMVTESAELLDAYKKMNWYDRELDLTNVKEEIGDALWYLLQLCDLIGYSLEQAKVDNIEKLKKRYPDGFKDVLVRDANKELDHIGQQYIEFEQVPYIKEVEIEFSAEYMHTRVNILMSDDTLVTRYTKKDIIKPYLLIGKKLSEVSF